MGDVDPPQIRRVSAVVRDKDVDAATRDELYLPNLRNGYRHAIPAEHIAAGNLTVEYASTINRAQGATVDEAHLIVDERTNSKQLYVGMTRGRYANYVHTAPPAFDPDQHGPAEPTDEWSATSAVAVSLVRQPGQVSAIERRRQLRGLVSQTQDSERDIVDIESPKDIRPSDPETERVAAAIRRLQQLARRPRTQGLDR